MAKIHALARIDLVVVGKLDRAGKTNVADEAAGTFAVRIADVGGTGELLVVRAQREPGRLTDEAATGGGALDGEHVQVESLRDVDCGACVRTDETYDTTGRTACRLNGSSGNIKGADVQSRAILDRAYEQTGITGARLDDTARGKASGKLNRPHRKGSALDCIR